MKIGEVYYWKTEKVIGHDDRNKYHLFMCLADWEDDHIFLFINKSGNAWDLEIHNTHPSFTYLPLNTSFIDCGSVVTYTTAEIAEIWKEHGRESLKGRININIAKSLLSKLHDSKVMRRSHKKKLCTVLRDVISKSEVNKAATH
ncbi:MAG: hypothetical protein ACRYGP_08235 [Janthinobacterium lividum]